MANKPHTDIERRAMWHVAKRLIKSGYTQMQAVSALYDVWRPPFDFSRVNWAVKDAIEGTPQGYYCWECGQTILPEHDTKRLPNGALAHADEEHIIPGITG